MRNFIILGLVGLFGLAACGDTVGEQALIGGGAGAVGATLIDGDPLLGAAAGAGANILFCQQNPSQC